MTQAAVVEPLESRIKAIRLATETAVMILNIEFVTSSLFKPTESTPNETTLWLDKEFNHIDWVVELSGTIAKMLCLQTI